LSQLLSHCNCSGLRKWLRSTNKPLPVISLGFAVVLVSQNHSLRDNSQCSFRFWFQTIFFVLKPASYWYFSNWVETFLWVQHNRTAMQLPKI
jgi:hypothetical protein